MRLTHLFGGLILALSLTVAVSATPPYRYGYNQYGYQQQYQNQLDIYFVPVNPDYYYSAFNEESALDKVKNEIIEEMRREVRGIKNANGDTGLRLNFNLLHDDESVEHIDRQVLALFNARCVQCHKPGATKPGVPLLTERRTLFTYNDTKKEARRREAVYEAVAGEESTMPKNGTPLSGTQKSLLKQWASQ